MAVITEFPNLGQSMLEASLRSRQLDQQADATFLESQSETNRLKASLIGMVMGDTLSRDQMAQNQSQFDRTFRRSASEFDQTMDFQRDAQSFLEESKNKEFNLLEEQFQLDRDRFEDDKEYRNKALQNQKIKDSFERMNILETSVISGTENFSAFINASQARLRELQNQGVEIGSSTYQTELENFNTLARLSASRISRQMAEYSVMMGVDPEQAKNEAQAFGQNMMMRYTSFVDPNRIDQVTSDQRKNFAGQFLSGEDYNQFIQNDEIPEGGILNRVYNSEIEKGGRYGSIGSAWQSIGLAITKDLGLQGNVVSDLAQVFQGNREDVTSFMGGELSESQIEAHYKAVVKDWYETGGTTWAQRVTGAVDADTAIAESSEQRESFVQLATNYFAGQYLRKNEVAGGEQTKFESLDDLMQNGTPLQINRVMEEARDKALPVEIRQGEQISRVVVDLMTIRDSMNRSEYKQQFETYFRDMGYSGSLANMRDKAIGDIQSGKVLFRDRSTMQGVMNALEGLLDFGSVRQAPAPVQE